MVTLFLTGLPRLPGLATYATDQTRADLEGSGLAVPPFSSLRGSAGCPRARAHWDRVGGDGLTEEEGAARAPTRAPGLVGATAAPGPPDPTRA